MDKQLVFSKKIKGKLIRFSLVVLLCCSVTGTHAEAAGFRKGPYLIHSGSNTGIRVLWQTDETPDHSKIEWGQVLPYTNSSLPLAESGPGDHEHQFVYDITDCQPETRYFYRVTVDSETFAGSFTTAPQATENSVTIYGYGDTRSQSAIQNSVLGSLLEDMNSDPFNHQTILLHSGDWVTAGDSENDWDNQFFNRNYPDTIEIMSRMSLAGCRGNHEQSGVLYRNYWPYSYPDDTGFYYAFDYGPVHVTVIDQYVSYLPGSAQYNWIEADLANTRKPWKFVLLHQPPWSAGGGHGNDISTQTYLCPLFEKYNVSIVQAGHNHYYARNQVNGIHYLTLGGGGAPLYEPDLSSSYLVVAEAVHHYARFDISDQILNFKAFRVDGSQMDSFEISKKSVVCPEIGTSETVGTVSLPLFDEISGIAASRQNQGILWVHNDYPGDHPEDADTIYAITVDGNIAGTYTISIDPAVRDPEDIAIGPGPLNGTDKPAAGHYIYWGDIGDNNNQYDEIWIKRIPEPLVDVSQPAETITLGPENGVDVIRLQYPSGEEAPSHKDSETLMVDPVTGDIYVVTKRMAPNKVYRASYPQSTTDVTTMEFVAELPQTPGLAWITGGDISFDGRTLILRNDGIIDYVNIWHRELETDIGSLLNTGSCLQQIASEPQGEAVCFDPSGTYFYTVSEAHNPSEPILKYSIVWEDSTEQVGLVAKGSSWAFMDDGSNQGTVWRELVFNDDSWSTGFSELGYGDGDEATVVGYGPDAGNKYITTYFRHAFETVNASSFSNLILSVKRDDGAIVFLNGTEVFRSHMPEGLISFDTLASNPAIYGVEELLFHDGDVDAGILNEGANVIAVEIHQQSTTSSDVSMDLELIGEREVKAPVVTSLPAQAIDWRSALLRGEVDPMGSDTDVVFECVAVDHYGAILNATQTTPLTGTTIQSVTAYIEELSPGTPYFFRVKAVNSFGTSYGNVEKFMTSPSPFSEIYVSKIDDTCGGNSPCYQSIQEAIGAAVDTATIKIAQGIYTEIPTLNVLKTVTLIGCWDPFFTGQIPQTTTIKSPLVSQGTMIIKDIVIKP